MKRYRYKTVRGLLSNTARWIKGYMAGIRNGEVTAYGVDDFINTDVRNSKADCFCLLGGIYKTYKGSQRKSAIKRTAQAVLELFPHRAEVQHPDVATITKFNDNEYTTIEDVRAIIRKARI